MIFLLGKLSDRIYMSIRKAIFRFRRHGHRRF